MANFSVVIPLFNEEQNIETLVNEIFLSLKNYNNFELILVDDASTDKTGDILNNLKNKNFKNIKIIALGHGPFVASYSLIYSYIKFLPFFYQIILLITYLLDSFIQIFVKTKLSEIFPIGYFFIAKK